MKTCPACGEENPDRARFCIACGTEFAPEHDQRFRKVITLLFCDLFDSGALTQRLPPDVLSEVLTTYYEAMRPIIERHGGTAADFIGDAIMSVFGVPVLHEDDALRACRAALEIQERLVDLNVELEQRWDVTLTLRMGLNTGEVSGVGVARAQNFVAGDAANTAARFQQNAAAGQILFGDATYGLVRDGVRVEELEPLTMKGKAEPVRTYRLLEVLSDAEALTRHHDVPLVGRQKELGQLRESFEQAVKARGCRMTTLVAEAGVGKSRLIEEFSRVVGDAALVLRGRCLPYGEGATFWPLGGVLSQLADVQETDAAEEARAKLAAVIGKDEEGIGERLASAVGWYGAEFATEFTLEELFWAVRKVFEVLAERHPLIVVFDDIHWAEPTFLDLIEHVRDNVHDVPFLMLCASRQDVLERRPSLVEHPLACVVPIHPLSEDEAGLVAENVLGEVDMADEVRARIIESAEGNPLFIEQLLSMLINDGHLRREDGKLVASADLASLKMPPTINALLAARLDSLRRLERSVIDPAAVIGLLFRRDAVEALATDADGAVGDGLDALSRKQLVRSESGEGHDDERFRFNHPLIRDAAYALLLKRTRAELHERFAEWAEHAYREHGRAAWDEVLGYHLEQAHHCLAELGPLDAHGIELGVRAAEWLGAAGRRSFGQGDMQTAAGLMSRAAALWPGDDPHRVELLPDLSEALASTGDFTQAVQLLDEAVERAGDLGDDPLHAEANLVRLHVRAFATEDGWSERILPEVEESMAVLERADRHAGLAKGWRLIGFVHGTACRYGEAANAVQQAILHARLAGDRRQELRNDSAYAQAMLSGPTPVPEAIDECERILELAEDDRGTRAFVFSILSLLHAMKGESAEARTCYVAARALFEDLGLTVLAAWVSLQSGPAELLAGDLHAAERELTRAYEALSEIGEKYYLSTVAGLLGQLRYEQGRHEEAREFAEEARALATDDDVESQALLRAVLAKVLAAEGAGEGALELVQEAVSLAHRTDSPVIQARSLVDLSVVLRANRRDARAAAAEAAAVALYERKGDTVSARKLGGLLAEPTDSAKSPQAG
jgi:class 3 adenylate cyclase/tetratricopeptide (TPR) repeat protein